MNKPDSTPKPFCCIKPYFCTYCGIRLSRYSGRRAEWEGCPNLTNRKLRNP